MTDPTYDLDEIKADPKWHVAYVLSEILNDKAPIGWSKYISSAECLLVVFNINTK